MNLQLDVLKKQGKESVDGHAEFRVILTDGNQTHVDSTYVAKIVTVSGKQVVEIQKK